MNTVKSILDNLPVPIIVIEMDHCDPNIEEIFTTKEKLLDEVENQGMNPKKQEQHDETSI